MAPAPVRRSEVVCSGRLDLSAAVGWSADGQNLHDHGRVSGPYAGKVDDIVKPLAEEALPMVVWDNVTRDEVVRAMKEYDRLGPQDFFAAHGFAPTTTYELVWEKHRYPPKAILGTAYEFATGQRLASGDFEGGKTGAVKVLGNLGFNVVPKK